MVFNAPVRFTKSFIKFLETLDFERVPSHPPSFLPFFLPSPLPALPCPALPCPALPCPALLRLCFFLFWIFLFSIRICCAEKISWRWRWIVRWFQPEERETNDKIFSKVFAGRIRVFGAAILLLIFVCFLSLLLLLWLWFKQLVLLLPFLFDLNSASLFPCLHFFCWFFYLCDFYTIPSSCFCFCSLICFSILIFFVSLLLLRWLAIVCWLFDFVLSFAWQLLSALCCQTSVYIQQNYVFFYNYMNSENSGDVTTQWIMRSVLLFYFIYLFHFLLLLLFFSHFLFFFCWECVVSINRFVEEVEPTWLISAVWNTAQLLF